MDLGSTTYQIGTDSPIDSSFTLDHDGIADPDMRAACEYDNSSVTYYQIRYTALDFLQKENHFFITLSNLQFTEDTTSQTGTIHYSADYDSEIQLVNNAEDMIVGCDLGDLSTYNCTTIVGVKQIGLNSTIAYIAQLEITFMSECNELIQLMDDNALVQSYWTWDATEKAKWDQGYIIRDP